MVSYIRSDLEFILEQIKVSEAHAAGQPLFGPGGLVPAYNLSMGLRTVDGTYNNLLPGQERWGAADIQFPEGLGTDFRPATSIIVDFDGPGGAPAFPTATSYAPSNNPQSVVADGSLRTISNLIVDQTLSNPAAIVTALERAGSEDPFADLVIVQDAAELIKTTAAAATAAQAAELAAAALVGPATTNQALAQAAYEAAVADSSATDAALADAAAAAAAATQEAVTDAVAVIASGTVIAAADITAVNAAVAAALVSLNAATAVAAALEAAHPEFADAAAGQTNAQSLYDQLVAIQTNMTVGDLRSEHLVPISDALTLSEENTVAADSLAADLNALVDPGEVAAALAALEAANSALAAAVANAAAAAAASDEADAAAAAAVVALADTLADFGIEMDGDNISLPNIAPDGGLSASFNSWFTLFGQFFDHGLDLVGKGGSGTVYIPLQPDDPLYVPGGHTNFMVLTRATVEAGDDGVMGTDDDVRPINTTTSFVDQNQTYTSHSSHQVFLREYVLDANGHPVATGKLIQGDNGGMATWGELKVQARDMLGIILSDSDVGNVPLLRTDQYGNFIPSVAGTPQIIVGLGGDGIPNTADDATVWGTPGIAGAIPLPAATIRIGHAFLADIAHNAVPDGLADGDIEIGLNNPGFEPGAYDNELLDAHFIAGDGRVNENIGLTAVHHVFHAEHNRLVEHTKAVILATGDNAFIQEWLVPGADAADGVTALEWNGERLFQAAKFGTEMQYQHLVFEEFARKIQPQINPFVVPDGYDVTINPSIVAEFAHVVYRFGHSMLTETIDRFDPSFNAGHIGLIEGFLNPFEFDRVGGTAHGVTDEVAAGAIIRGMTRQVGNEIDEFVTSALRNNLLGLPLDLATINLARGRDTGVPSLNEARREFYEATNSAAELKPYESWVEFAANLKHEASIINFIAAYGLHPLITGETTIEGKRDAALTLITGQPVGKFADIVGFVVPTDAVDFLNSAGAWASGPNGVTTTGLDNVDLWIGGLAEKILPFGGMLGSTFNFVFEVQLEQLQNGDRFYYLQRLDGLHLFGEMEANSFAAMMMRNTDATHLPSDVFSVPGLILEVDQTRQYNPGLGETVGLDGILEDDPETTDYDESADNLGLDPTGGGILTPLVIRNNPATLGPDTNYLRYTGDQHVVLGGTDQDDILIASEGDDALYGDDGDDFLEGGAGNDVHNGGDGDDIIKDLGGDDNIKGGSGNDVINSGPGLDLVLGGAGKDFIFLGNDAGGEVFGGEGDDFIYGNKNAERLLGNEGNDWLETGTFDGAPGDNFDEIFARDGVVGHDVFLGDGGFDEFIGEGGDDVMVGSPGRGKMAGMSGWDWITYKDNTFAVDADLTRGIVFDEFPNPPVNGTLDAYESVEGVSGSRFNDIITGADTLAEERLPHAQGGSQGYTGSALNAEGIARIGGLQAVVGTGVTSYLAGDILLGGDGSDRIAGRAGDDIIDGDKWLDVYISVRDPNNHAIEIARHKSMTTLAADMFAGLINPAQLEIVREIVSTADGTPDIDTAVFSGPASEYVFAGNIDGSVQVTHTIEDGDGSDKLRGIERIEFAGGQSYNLIVGTTGNDPALNGTAGDDLIIGLAGNDTLNGFGGNDILVGSSGTDTLNGNEGDDVLDGGADNDTLSGGTGNDTYNVRPGDGNDTINEAGGGGLLDRLVIQTGSTEDVPVALTALNAFDSNTGTQNGNLVINVNTQSITVANHFSGAAAQTGIERVNFSGASYNGYLLGFEDYIVGRADPGGDRTVNLSASTVNNFIVGEGGGTDDEITGGSGNDLIFGGTGDNDLQGGAGEDLLVGGSDNNDDDTLDGGLDADVMVGLNGNDTYVVDDVADVVIEAAGANTGTDTIETEMATLSIELVANVENLVYTGIDADPFVGTGNALNNEISGGDLNDVLSGLGGNDELNGGIGNDTLNGGDGNDTLNGGDDNDVLTGGIGADTLDGDAGADTMAGGAGDDIYFVDDGGDVVNETAAGSDGIDRVESTISYVLGTNVENLDLNGGDAINGTGNALANVINGNGSNNQLFGGGANDNIDGGNGSDLIDGGTGDDTLSGGTGDDTDIIIGGDGNDTINLLAAGGGNDVIRYAANGFGADVLNNFDPTGGSAATQDLIDLSALGVTAANLATRVIESTIGGTSTLLTVRDAAGVNTIGTIQINGVANAAIDVSDYILATAPSAPTITGTTGNNNPLNGTVNSEAINALAGNDVVNALGGSDVVDAGEGTDTVNGGDGNDTIAGGLGNDTLNGDAGDDTFVWNANPGGGTAGNGAATDGRDLINGGTEGGGGDTFVINGNASAEQYRIYTRQAWDDLGGNSGASLHADTEIVITRSSTNTDFNNSVIAQLREIEEIRINGVDPAANGTSSGDTVQIIGNFSGTSLRLNTITIDGEAGDDTVDISSLGSAHRIVFRSNGGNDTIIGTLRSQDVIELPAGMTIADFEVTIGEDGLTTLVGDEHTITFVASNGMPQFSDGTDDEDDDIDDDDDDAIPGEDGDGGGIDDDDEDGASLPLGTRIGTSQADVLVGTAGDDAIIAFAGDDVVFGAAGADSISVAEGADFVNGGIGNDTIFAGLGDDQVFGGAGNDTLFGDAGADRLFGEDGNDLITAGADDDTVFAGANDDVILAQVNDGDDAYFGDAGVDTLDMSAATTAITVNLGSGPLGSGTATGSQIGNDVLYSVENVSTGSGNDTITASNAVNVMSGGAGNDVFAFNTTASADGDTILGFEPGDRLSFSGIDANVGTAGDQAFTILSGGNFTAAGQLAVSFVSREAGDFTVIQGNVDGDLGADFSIEVEGHHTLSGANTTL